MTGELITKETLFKGYLQVLPLCNHSCRVLRRFFSE